MEVITIEDLMDFALEISNNEIEYITGVLLLFEASYKKGDKVVMGSILYNGLSPNEALKKYVFKNIYMKDYQYVVINSGNIGYSGL